MPRLSVDIDLTYLPIADREASLRGIDAAMRRIAGSMTASLPSARVHPGTLKGENAVNKLIRPRRPRADQDRGDAGVARLRVRAAGERGLRRR